LSDRIIAVKIANGVHLQKLVNARSVSGEFQVIDAIIVGVRLEEASL
jgi:ABC-type transporter MlaC component